MTAVIIPKSAPFNNPTSGDDFGDFLKGGFRGSASLISLVQDRRLGFSAAVSAYLANVESADGQQLENGVFNALGTLAEWRIPFGGAFAPCFGARTLEGSLVPMVGPAPLNMGFEAGDYTRWSGLGSDGSKHLNPNYTNTTDGQDDRHIYTRLTALGSNDKVRWILGGLGTAAGNTILRNNAAANHGFMASSASISNITGSIGGIGGLGAARQNSADLERLVGGVGSVVTMASAAPTVGIYLLAGSGPDNGYNGRYAGYSFGPYVDLTVLDSRVGQCLTQVAAALDPLWSGGGGLPLIDLDFGA